jgi:hypothetical protein
MPVHRQPIRTAVLSSSSRWCSYTQSTGDNPGNKDSRIRTVNRDNDHRTNRDRSILNKIADRILETTGRFFSTSSARELSARKSFQRFSNRSTSWPQSRWQNFQTRRESSGSRSTTTYSGTTDNKW